MAKPNIKVIKRDPSKGIIFGWDGDKNKRKWDTKVKEAYEDCTYDDYEINKFQLVKAILFEKGFLWRLGMVIKYTLRHSESYRGTGASDYMLFENTKGFEKMWRKK